MCRPHVRHESSLWQYQVCQSPERASSRKGNRAAVVELRCRKAAKLESCWRPIYHVALSLRCRTKTLPVGSAWQNAVEDRE